MSSSLSEILYWKMAGGVRRRADAPWKTSSLCTRHLMTCTMWMMSPDLCKWSMVQRKAPSVTSGSSWRGIGIATTWINREAYKNAHLKENGFLCIASIQCVRNGLSPGVWGWSWVNAEFSSQRPFSALLNATSLLIHLLLDVQYQHSI